MQVFCYSQKIKNLKKGEKIREIPNHLGWFLLSYITLQIPLFIKEVGMFLIDLAFSSYVNLTVRSRGNNKLSSTHSHSVFFVSGRTKVVHYYPPPDPILSSVLHLFRGRAE